MNVRQLTRTYDNSNKDEDNRLNENNERNDNSSFQRFRQKIDLLMALIQCYKQLLAVTLKDLLEYISIFYQAIKLTD